MPLNYEILYRLDLISNRTRFYTNVYKHRVEVPSSPLALHSFRPHISPRVGVIPQLPRCPKRSVPWGRYCGDPGECGVSCRQLQLSPDITLQLNIVSRLAGRPIDNQEMG